MKQDYGCTPSCQAVLLSRAELEQKLREASDEIDIVMPENIKSHVWKYFRPIVYRGVRQNFVKCLDCDNVLAYKSKTGTASLLRHKCEGRCRETPSESSAMHRPSTSAASLLPEPGPDMKEEERDLQGMEADVMDDITIKQEPIFGYSDGSFPEPDVSMEELDSKGDLSFKLQKHELEALIRANDPSITARDPTKYKNHMWKQFKIIFYNSIRQDFIRCMNCGVVLSYKKKTGTASLVRHRCNMRAPSKSPPHSLHGTFKYSPTSSADAVTEAEQANRQQAMTSALVSLMPHFLASSGLRGESKIIPPADLAHFATAQIKFAARDLLPLAFFQQPGFHEFAQILLNIGAEYGHQSIESILTMPRELGGTHLEEVMARMKEEIKVVLQGNDICVCLDLWRHKDDMCLTVEAFLIDENFILTRYNLGSRMLSEPSAQDIRTIVHEILSEYLDSVHFEGLKMVIRMEDTVIREAFPNATVMNCMCELLIRVLDDLLSEFPTFLKSIDDLSQHLMQQGAAPFGEGVLEGGQPTRWHKYFRLLKAISNFSETDDGAEDIFQEFFHENLETIIQILDFLEPFQQCLDSLRSEGNTTLNEVYLWNKKFQQSGRILPKNGDIVGRIKTTASTLLKKHFSVEQYHKIALFLDPNFKNMRFMHEDEKNDILDVVRQELEAVMGSTADDSASNVKKCTKLNLSDPIPGSSNSTLINFMEFMDNSVSEEPIETEIKTYMDIRLTEPVDVLAFWKGFNQCPSLKKLARRVLNIPATSSRSRHALSPDSIYVSEKIQNLPKDEMIPLLFLRQNTGLQ